MATSVEYLGLTGSQTAFSIPFDYLKKTHVKATIDGVLVDPATYTVDGSTVTFDTAPVGDLVIYRETDLSQKLVTFTRAAPLRASDLNLQNDQVLFGVQEETQRLTDLEAVVDPRTGLVDGRDVSVDGMKLDGIESGATADLTGAEIKTLLFALADTNNLTDTLLNKLTGIEAEATADQTGAEIKTLLFAETDTNNLTDTLLNKLNGIEAGADVTDSENVTTALGSVSVNAHSDVNTSGAANTNVLAFNGVSGQWEPSTAGSGDAVTAGNNDFTGSNSFFAGVNFTLKDPTDTTKQVRVDASGITTGTIRTKTVQDVSGTLYETGGVDVSVADGGTGASTSAAARDNLGIYQVDSIADMTALSEADLADGDQCEVAYYFNEGDEGGGLFRWDAASTTATDSGWYFAPDTSDGTGRWVRVNRKAVNVRHFGAQGDGVADAAETSALTAAYNKWVSLMGSKGAQFPAATQVPFVVPAGDYLPDSVLTWSPVGTGAQLLCFGTLREIQINPQGSRQSYTGLHLAGTADETSAATYGILLDDDLSDSVHVQDFIIRDRPTGLRIAATNAGNNNFINGLIRDCTVLGLHYDAGSSNNFVNVHSDGNKKNLLIDGGTDSGEGKFNNCRFGNTLARGDDINAHIIGTSTDNAVESYFTQCTFTASRNDGRLLSITGVTDAGGGRIRVTTGTEHKMSDTWDDSFSVSGTTSYNGTFDASTVNLTVISATVIEYDETYVASETGTLELPPWDLYIESDTASDIGDTNDMFFQGGNINHTYIKSALKVQFIGTRLKQSIFFEGPDALNKKGVHRIFIVGDARGRAQNSLADVPVAGATAGWVRIGTKDDNGGRTPSDTKFVIETPDTSAALGSNNLPTTHKVELSGSAFKLIFGATEAINASDDGTVEMLAAKFLQTGTSANKLEMASVSAGQSPILRPIGSDTDINFRLDTKGAGDFDFRTNGGTRALLINHVAGATDFFQLQGGSGIVSMIANGSSADVFCDVRSKGTANVRLRSGAGTSQVQVNDTGVGFYGTSPVAKIDITGSRGGNAALADLLTKLATTGLITDSTTA